MLILVLYLKLFNIFFKERDLSSGESDELLEDGSSYEEGESQELKTALRQLFSL